MSCFMVEARTIDRVLSYLFWKKDSDSRISEELKEAGYGIPGPEELNRLGMAMLRMNREAVNQRYAESETLKEPYQFSDCLPDKYQALKSLHCFLYQCCEGTVPQTKLYKALTNTSHYLADAIVHELTLYQEAEWG